jgi:hypothetical protein
MKIKDIHLLIEMDNGDIHQALLDEYQTTAIKSIVIALGKGLKVLDKPLNGLYVDRKEETK